MDRKNQELWLQGMYIYDALCCVSPVMRAFVKKGTKAVPYPKQPYPISQRQQEQNKINEEKRIMNKGKAFMLALMARQNAQNNKQDSRDCAQIKMEERRDTDG